MEKKHTIEHGIESGESAESPWMDAGNSVREQLFYMCESAPKSEHHKEMSFLRQLMRYDQTGERHDLEAKLARAERHERCVRRAMWLMVVLTGLAVAGLGYSAILLEDFPPNTNQFVVRMFCALGLTSLISLLVFVGVWLVSRGELNVQREGCRRLVTRIVELRLGKPAFIASAGDGRTELLPDRLVAGGS